MGGILASRPEKDRAARQELSKICGSVPPVPLLAGRRNCTGGEKGVDEGRKKYPALLV